MQAQLYALDKNQKWSPLTSDIVTVSFLYNNTDKSTRILSTHNGKSTINSLIAPSMQYRRPSDTFVQWFDSQHILYGLNLTSVSDAEGVNDLEFIYNESLNESLKLRVGRGFEMRRRMLALVVEIVCARRMMPGMVQQPQQLLTPLPSLLCVKSQKRRR